MSETPAFRGRSDRGDGHVYASLNEVLAECFPHFTERERQRVTPREPWDHDDDLRMVATDAR